MLSNLCTKKRTLCIKNWWEMSATIAALKIVDKGVRCLCSPFISHFCLHIFILCSFLIFIFISSCRTAAYTFIYLYSYRIKTLWLPSVFSELCHNDELCKSTLWNIRHFFFALVFSILTPSKLYCVWKINAEVNSINQHL